MSSIIANLLTNSNEKDLVVVDMSSLPGIRRAALTKSVDSAATVPATSAPGDKPNDSETVEPGAETSVTPSPAPAPASTSTTETTDSASQAQSFATQQMAADDTATSTDDPTGVEKMLAWSLKGWPGLHPDHSTNKLPTRLSLWSPRGSTVFVCGTDTPKVHRTSGEVPDSVERFVHLLLQSWRGDPAEQQSPAQADFVYANALRDLQHEQHPDVAAETSHEPQGVLEARARICLVEQVCGALRVMKRGGSLVCQLTDTLTRFSVGTVFLLHQAFGRLAFMKPSALPPSSSARVMVCMGYCGADACAPLIAHLKEVIVKMQAAASSDDISVDVVEILPTEMILQKDFWEFMSKMNDEFTEAHTKALQDDASDADKHSAYVAKLETQLRERFAETPVRRTKYLSVVTLKPKKPSKTIAFESAGSTAPTKRNRDSSSRTSHSSSRSRQEDPGAHSLLTL